MRHIDIQEMEQIKDLCKELEHLKKRLHNITSSLQVSHATVKSTPDIYPYIERIITISGIDRASFDKATALCKRDMEVKIDEIMRKVAKVQAYIDTVKDADMRIILQSRYINRLTWEQIENDFGISGRTARWKLHKWRLNLP